MNHKFVVKMMQAKKLEYEAIKELMPEPVEQMFDKMEKEAVETIKEFAMKCFFEEEEFNSQHSENKESDPKVKKVKIEV